MPTRPRYTVRLAVVFLVSKQTTVGEERKQEKSSGHVRDNTFVQSMDLNSSYLSSYTFIFFPDSDI